jgi:hypothetical protein
MQDIKMATGSQGVAERFYNLLAVSKISPMSGWGQTRPWGGVGSMSGLSPESGRLATSVDCPKGAIPVIAAIRGTERYGISGF